MSTPIGTIAEIVAPSSKYNGEHGFVHKLHRGFKKHGVCLPSRKIAYSSKGIRLATDTTSANYQKAARARDRYNDQERGPWVEYVESPRRVPVPEDTPFVHSHSTSQSAGPTVATTRSQSSPTLPPPLRVDVSPPNIRELLLAVQSLH